MSQDEVELRKEQEKYIDLAIEPKIKNKGGELAYSIATSFAYIAAYEMGRLKDGKVEIRLLDDKIDELQKEYKMINAWLAQQIFEDMGKVKELFELSQGFNGARELWDSHRALLAKHRGEGFEFKDFAVFYKWFLNQPSKEVKSGDKVHYEKCCAFCDATKWDLEQKLKHENVLIALNLRRKFMPIFRVVKSYDKKGYKPKCVLVCAFCDKAKKPFTNKITFTKRFLACIKGFYKPLKACLSRFKGRFCGNSRFWR
ncbi:hypothetical protein [Campylobacter troglodytis]|uniref:hypothetical protein n=1 Tax=Campylobacter troglodytis TaxID=654363 RepID=UPI00115C02DB|nr:hypothetical protein [Campylobacter troglodytis]TQR61657.1 hypothetical protein DMC01_00385 [Campylobacter troglodytis]